jgi:hypothetical protein
MAARDFMQFMSRGDIPLLDPLVLERQYQDNIFHPVLRRTFDSMAGRVLPANVRLASAEGPNSAEGPGDLSGVAQFGEAPAQAPVLPSAVQRYRDRASELYRQGADLYGQEPDMSQFEDFARQRAQGGNAAMLNALAAQFAGEQFQPVQAQFLKKAAAAQDPIKLGSGMLTPEGRYIKDPIAAQDKRAEFLLQQARAYETLAQTAATAEERAEAARLAREAAERHRELIAEMQRVNIDSQIANRNVLAGIAQQSADTARQRAQSDAALTAQRQADARQNAEVMQGLARDRNETNRLIAQMSQGGRNDKRADTLRGEYLKRADKVREGTGHAQNVLQLLSDPTIANDPTKQVSLIFSFGKMLDPESVVRESEYALIASARGIFDTAQQIVPRIQSGARLSPQQLKSMSQVAENLMQGATTRIEALDQFYADLARRRNLNVEDVLPSFNSRRGSGSGDGGGQNQPNRNAPLSADEQAELQRLRQRFGNQAGGVRP